uniref:RHOMBOID-like protein n=1 Tax=Kalanchoe fedtschenkoi TaxID=63787 RepID=A0A7N0TKJ0_KALFE
MGVVLDLPNSNNMVKQPQIPESILTNWVEEKMMRRNGSNTIFCIWLFAGHASRVGLIYILSALCGSLTAALFLRNRPTVGSSGATFGLLGTMLAALIHLSCCLAGLLANILLGLMPLINCFANIGGITAGLLLGLLIPHVNDVAEDGLDKHGSKKSIYMKRKFVLVACLCIFVFIVAGGVIALHSMNFNQECQGCHSSGINIGVQYLFMLLSIPLLVNFTLQGEEEAAVIRLRSLDHLERRLTAARNEYNDTSEILNRAKGSSESKKKLSKIEKKLSVLALSVDAAQTKFDQTRDFVSRRPTVQSVQDLELVRRYLPQVTAVFSSGSLRNSLNREKLAEVAEKAARMSLSFD